MTFKLSKTSQQRLKGVNPKIIEIIELALTITKIDFGIPEYGGLRDKAEQNDLFKRKLSKADGYDKSSIHQSGNAFDIYAYINGGASWDKLYLTTVAAAILQASSLLGYKLSWGGLWSNFIDLPHFQLEEQTK